MISFERVSKTYRPFFGQAVTAVDGLSVEVQRGEVFGIAGPNGAGKSTMLAMLLGFIAPSSGTVRIDGRAPRDYVEHEGVGYVPEIVEMPGAWRTDHALERYALLAGVGRNQLPRRVEEVIKLLGLEEHREKKVRALSKGTRQRLAIAQALLAHEKLVVFDEPTHGLDPVWTLHFRDIVRALRANDRAIVIASHNLDELQRLADRVMIIDGGRMQRVVDVGAADTSEPTREYRIVLVTGDEYLARVFPGAEPLADGGYEIAVADARELSAGLAQLLAHGAVISEVTPMRSSLEEHFRQAIDRGGAE